MTFLRPKATNIESHNVQIIVREIVGIKEGTKI